MKLNFYFVVTTILILSFSILSGQNEKSKKNGVKTINSTQSVNDEIHFKNETGSPIITFTDEGNNNGSITIPDSSAPPANTNNKLYNVNGTLNFNGTALGGSGTTLSIGDNYQGGIIIWLDPSGQHGLIVSSQDLNNGTLIPFKSNPNTPLVASSYGNGIYLGEVNSKSLISFGNFVPTDPVYLCDLYSITENSVTYDDWYLPSLDELHIMMTNLYLQNPANFSTQGYWSSTQELVPGSLSFYAFSASMGSPWYIQLINISVPFQFAVRAVRRF